MAERVQVKELVIYHRGKRWLSTAVAVTGLGWSVNAEADTTENAIGVTAVQPVRDETVEEIEDATVSHVARVATTEVAEEPMANRVAETDEVAVSKTAAAENIESDGDAATGSRFEDVSEIPETGSRQVRLNPVPVAGQPDDESQPTTAVQPTRPQTAELPTMQNEPAYTDETIDQWLPNHALQEVVLYRLQHTYQDNHKTWSSVADITQKDMLRLTELYVNGDDNANGITTYIDGKTPFSIQGLEYAVNLTTLALESGGLNYPGYQLNGDLVDLTPLKKLKKLTWLNLRGNRIQDISPLADLKNLTTLYLDKNRIADFSWLQGRKFETLEISKQFVILPPIRVDSKQRSAWIKSPFKFIDNQEVALWSPMQYINQTLGFHPETADFDFYRYESGVDVNDDEGTVMGTGDAWGDLQFNHIRLQEPGGTTDLEPYQQPLPDRYYLICDGYTDGYVGQTSDSEIGWYLIQPYSMVASAETIIVHYVDQSGKKLHADDSLPAGEVGQSYQTVAKEIPGYTVTTPPSNASGKYSREKIEVTYVYQKLAVAGPQPGGTLPAPTPNGVDSGEGVTPHPESPNSSESETSKPTPSSDDDLIEDDPDDLGTEPINQWPTKPVTVGRPVHTGYSVQGPVAMTSNRTQKVGQNSKPAPVRLEAAESSTTVGRANAQAVTPASKSNRPRASRVTEDWLVVMLVTGVVSLLGWPIVWWRRQRNQ